MDIIVHWFFSLVFLIPGIKYDAYYDLCKNPRTFFCICVHMVLFSTSSHISMKNLHNSILHVALRVFISQAQLSAKFLVKQTWDDSNDVTLLIRNSFMFLLGLEGKLNIWVSCINSNSFSYCIQEIYFFLSQNFQQVT